MLHLCDSTRVGRGAAREVYLHPHMPGWLVKVFRPEKLARLGRRRGLVARLKRMRVAGPYRVVGREFAAVFDATMRAERLGLRAPLPLSTGMVATDRGPGQLVEMIAGPGGAPAPTLRSLAAEGALGTAHLEALSDFARLLFDLRIVAPDLSPKNIVLEETGRWVLIDGYGEPSVIPLRRWIRPLGERHLSAMLAETARKAGLEWRARDRSFRLPDGGQEGLPGRAVTG